MKIKLLLLLLLSSNVLFAQRRIDTIELYNGVIKHKQIQVSKSGQIEKETYFYKDGKIELEYFYKNNEKVHWISYDKDGIKSAEWMDPEFAYAPKKRLRIIVFILTAVSLSLLVFLSSKYLTYKGTYFSMLFLTILYPIFSMVIQRRIDLGKLDPKFGSFFASLLILLPSLLFILSILNLIKKKDIPLVFSLMSIVICLFFFMFVGMVFNISGAGIIG